MPSTSMFPTMAARLSVAQKQTVVTTTTTTTQTQSTEHQESADRLLAIDEDYTKSRKRSGKQKHSSSSQITDLVKSSGHKDSSRREHRGEAKHEASSHKHSHCEQSSRTETQHTQITQAIGKLERAQRKTSRKEPRHSEKARKETRRTESAQIETARRSSGQREDSLRNKSRKESGHTKTTHSQTTRTEVVRHENSTSGEPSRKKNHRAERDRIQSRRGENRRQNRSQTETSRRHIRRGELTNHENQIDNMQTIVNRSGTQYGQEESFEQVEDYEQHGGHDYAVHRQDKRVGTMTTTNTTTITTLNELQESFVNGGREEYGDQSQLQDLYHRLQERSQDESLDPGYWPAAQRFSWNMEEAAGWQGPTPHPFEGYLWQLEIWDYDEYPAMPFDAGVSIAREVAISQGTVEFHDNMIAMLLSSGGTACPGALPWEITEIGYVCLADIHFIPHSEIDMILAGVRPDGPFIWDTHFKVWATAGDWIRAGGVY